MRDILPELLRWQRAGKRCAIARVVRVEGSGPREPGAAMAVNESGEVVGSVSGGCIEGAVVSEAAEVIQTGESRTLSFGVTNEMAWEVGLACGGEVDIYLEKLS